MPPLRHAELDGEARRDPGWQHLVPIALRLRLEQVPARHRYAANRDTGGAQSLGGSDDETDFRAAGDKDQYGPPVARVAQHVGAAAQTLGAGVPAPVESRDLLSGQDELRAQVSELFAAHALPTTMSDVDPEAVALATERDKKIGRAHV